MVPNGQDSRIFGPMVAFAQAKFTFSQICEGYYNQGESEENG